MKARCHGPAPLPLEQACRQESRRLRSTLLPLCFSQYFSLLTTTLSVGIRYRVQRLVTGLAVLFATSSLSLPLGSVVKRLTMLFTPSSLPLASMELTL